MKLSFILAIAYHQSDRILVFWQKRGLADDIKNDGILPSALTRFAFLYIYFINTLLMDLETLTITELDACLIGILIYVFIQYIHSLHHSLGTFTNIQ